MPNKNYEKGRRKEYKIVEKYRKRGYDIVQRSAGSHSPIDVFAINKTTNIIKLIQCKPDTMSDTQIDKILEEQKELNDAYTVEFVVE
jgi:Holliday junction resolvase